MTTEKQSQAGKRNIKKAQEVWKGVSSRAHARAQPEGRGRAKPGSTGEGDYYHIEVRPKGQFATFRTHDVGKKGGIQRVAGKRRSGSWDDQKWLISKEHAHVEDGKLIADTGDARELLAALGSEPVHVTGDRFQAKPRPNVPEEEKPTPAQRRAQQKTSRKPRRRAGRADPAQPRTGLVAAFLLAGHWSFAPFRCRAKDEGGQAGSLQLHPISWQ